MKSQKALIEIRTGSDSDIPKIRKAYEFLDSAGIAYSPRILSAHRTPEAMASEARRLSESGFFVSIAAAGGAAHLPGMTASETVLPVIGLPVTTANLNGQDSLYSIIQMPDGIPVGCVGIGDSESAAVLAAQIVCNNDIQKRIKIRALRRIEGALPDTNRAKPLAGIVMAAGTGTDNRKYSEMLSLLEQFGLQVKILDIDPENDDGVKDTVRKLEAEGAVAITVIGELGRQRNTNHLPAVVSEITDVPVIGLPIAKGFAGSTPDNQQDIFRGMLHLAQPGAEAKGCPVAGMGINRYVNAGLFTAQIAGLFFPEVQQKVKAYRETLAESVREKDKLIRSEGITPFLK